MSTMGSSAGSSSTSSACSAASRCSSAIWCGGFAIALVTGGELRSVMPGRVGRPVVPRQAGPLSWLVRRMASSTARPAPKISLARSYGSCFCCARLHPAPPTSRVRWHLIDAEGAILGRMATEIATLLRGKHKPIWAPHVDTGDHVIVINASKLAIDPQEGDRQAVPPPHGIPGRYPHREPRALDRSVTPSASCGSPCAGCFPRARWVARC